MAALWRYPQPGPGGASGANYRSSALRHGAQCAGQTRARTDGGEIRGLPDLPYQTDRKPCTRTRRSSWAAPTVTAATPQGAAYRRRRAWRDPAYQAVMEQAHVLPRYPESWHYPSSANPERTYTLLNKESPEFTRFTNPSDYRIARSPAVPATCHHRGLGAQPARHLGHAVGRRGLQQRHPALQALHARRGLHPRGRGRR
jgi:hypothetical protein